jgi:hypothetical protein
MPEHGSGLNAFNPMLAANANKLEHRQLWHCETFAAYLDDQSGDNGKRQRHLDNEARSAGRRLHVDGAANLLDIAAHDIHSDAAAGNAGDLQGGSKNLEQKSGC